MKFLDRIPLRSSLKPLALALALAVGLGVMNTQAAINVGASGSGVQSLDTIPAATSWSTKNTWLGAAGDITDAAGLDAAVQLLASTDIAAVVGSSGTNPPSVSVIARFNTTLQALQTNPTGAVKGCLLMATLQNTKGAAINQLEIAYDFAKPVSGTEEVPGLRCYYSQTGAAGSWTVVPALCTSTPGALATVVTLSSPWADATPMYVLWADDNSAATGDAYTLDNVLFGLGADIKTFGLPGTLACSSGARYSSYIDTNITWYVPGPDVTALAPSLTLSSGASSVPATDVATDFTNPVHYIVTAADPLVTKDYTVTVVVGTVPVSVSNVLTPVEPLIPNAGVRIDVVVPSGGSALLVGLTQTHWSNGGFTRNVFLNGNTLKLDSGGGNGANYAGPISGAGAVIIQNNGQTIGGSLGNTYTGTTNVNTVVTLNKSSGNALCGTITGAGAAITWSANNQIDDSSDVTLNSASHLTLGAHTETISKLYLVTGAYVDTGAEGILKVSELYLNGVQQAPVGKGSGDGFVLGTGYIDVANSGAPVVSTAPDKPASPVPTDGTTGLHPMFVALLNWADAAGATSYDVYLWDASGSQPGTPTATVSLSQYAPTLPLNSNATYNWQVVAQNAVGPTNGDVWTFTTTDASHVSNVLTPADPANPAAGVRIDTIIPSGGTALLVGLTRTHWSNGGFSRAVDLNGNTFLLDSGGGNGANYAGPISGNGTVTIQNNGQTIGGSLGNTYTGTTNVNTVVTLNKSSGNALCGTITGSGGYAITWAANDQINDTSSVTLASGFSLALAGHTETIAGLTLATGTSVATGAVTGGVLTVANLTVGGSVMPVGTYTFITNPEFVTGLGSVIVPATGTATATVVTGNGTSTVGDSVTLTATVSPTPTGGTVQFLDNGTAFGGAVTVESGVASLPWTSFSAGSHPITATFSGTTGFLTSTSSPAVTQTVLSKYETWAVLKGLTLGVNAGPNDDPDADAVPNVIEFAFNGNPKNAADNGMIHALTEDVTARAYGYGKVLILTVAVRAGTDATWTDNTATIDGITYTIQGGTTLGDFASDTGTVFACPDPITTGLPAEPGTGYEWRSFILDSSNGLGAKGFLRARVVEAP